jgi:hypothetical protein
MIVHQEKDMNLNNDSLQGLKHTRTLAILAALIFSLLALTACGGGSGTTVNDPVAVVDCNPADPSSFAECGSVMIALTDADGDFLNYTVDVLSLKLETANGRIVETLPRKTRINFTDYVDLTELVTVATIPPATYVAGTIRLDYGEAEVFVEADGAAKQAVVTDAAGNTLTQTELRIRLSNRDQLNVIKGRSAISWQHRRRPPRNNSSSPKWLLSMRRAFVSADRSQTSVKTR